MSPSMNMNNNDMINKQLNNSGPTQYPLTPDSNSSSHMRPLDQGMNNHNTPSSQSQPVNSNTSNNHNTPDGTHPLSHPQQAPPTNQQQNSVGDDLNFDPTAIIDGDGPAPSLEVSFKVFVFFFLSSSLAVSKA